MEKFKNPADKLNNPSSVDKPQLGNPLSGVKSKLVSDGKHRNGHDNSKYLNSRRKLRMPLFRGR